MGIWADIYSISIAFSSLDKASTLPSFLWWIVLCGRRLRLLSGWERAALPVGRHPILRHNGAQRWRDVGRMKETNPSRLIALFWRRSEEHCAWIQGVFILSTSGAYCGLFQHCTVEAHANVNYFNAQEGSILNTCDEDRFVLLDFSFKNDFNSSIGVIHMVKYLWLLF